MTHVSTTHSALNVVYRPGTLGGRMLPRSLFKALAGIVGEAHVLTVAALVGPGNWGIDGDAGSRIAWATLGG